MKTGLKTLIGVIFPGIAILAIAPALSQAGPEPDLKQAVADTRRVLREQGFKTDLGDFNFSTDAAARAREAALTRFSSTVRRPTPGEMIDFMPMATDDAPIVIWQQEWLKTESDPVPWTDLQDWLDENRKGLDAACEAAGSGPIRFNLEASRGAAMLLKHLAPLKQLSQVLGSRALLELHAGHPDAAWTNLFAATRLVTAWEPEPAEVSQQVRFAMTSLAFNETWQVLQTNHWPDDLLARLQAEWEMVDYFKYLPETVAFKRAYMVDLCQRERQEPEVGGFSGADFFKELVESPGSAWHVMTRYLNESSYRSQGSYEDETNLLRFYRDREVELRNAVKAATWLEMRQLPGVTNPVFFPSKYRSRWFSMMSIRETTTARFNGRSSFPSRAAEAEARRRILVTAIALERYRGRHGAYPPALGALAPEILKTVPVDFMDGQPLRYRPTDDGHFILYSVGLDCVDNGGKIQARGTRQELFRRRGAFMGSGPSGDVPEADIVWPRPATAAEAAAKRELEEAARAQQVDEAEAMQANAQWELTARHQAAVDALLAPPVVTNLPDVIYHGRPLSETLGNPASSGANRLSLLGMLTLRQIITGAEPETVTYEVPIAYAVVTNLGELCLYIDPTNNDDSEEGCNVQQMECDRATNGDCLLVWSTIYERPGKHALQAGLILNDLPPDKQAFAGPLQPYAVSNLCQFSITSAHFDQAAGATWRARLVEQNGRYVLECNTTNGMPLRTFAGTTSNGDIKVHWDLTDSHGQRFTGDDFDSVFRLTLPDSGRTQTLRGP